MVGGVVGPKVDWLPCRGGVLSLAAFLAMAAARLAWIFAKVSGGKTLPAAGGTTLQAVSPPPGCTTLQDLSSVAGLTPVTVLPSWCCSRHVVINRRVRYAAALGGSSG